MHAQLTARSTSKPFSVGNTTRSCRQRNVFTCASASSVRPQLQRFPASYDQAVRQAQEAVKAALADGLKLIEVEFPTSGLDSVSGDGEGQNEMNLSMDYIRRFLSAFRDKQEAVRVFFPDSQEVAIAQSGQTADPNAGRVEMEPKFEGVKYGMGYLTKQNPVWAALGVNLEQFTPSQLVKDSDEIFLVAYPHFNPREELSAVEKLYQESAREQGRPIIIFNGELDRIRGGYYPGLFFPGLAKLAREFIPRFEAVYYIHNFKGSRPGALYRSYPGPWQVLRRGANDPEELTLLRECDSMPTLREVAEMLASS